MDDLVPVRGKAALHHSSRFSIAFWQVKRRISVQGSMCRNTFITQLAVLHGIAHDHQNMLDHFGPQVTPPRAKPKSRHTAKIVWSLQFEAVFVCSASPGGTDDFAEIGPWLTGVAGKIKVPVSKFSLSFIAESLFATDLFVKTGLKLQPHKDYSPQGRPQCRHWLDTGY